MAAGLIGVLAGVLPVQTAVDVHEFDACPRFVQSFAIDLAVVGCIRNDLVVGQQGFVLVVPPERWPRALLKDRKTARPWRCSEHLSVLIEFDVILLQIIVHTEPTLAQDEHDQKAD